MPPARRLDGSGPPRRAPRSSSRWRVLAACAAFLALLPTGARANAADESQPSSSGSSSSHGHASSIVDDVTVEEFALDGPESVQDHVNVAMREARTRPDYDAAVNPILEGGWVRARAVAAATARGDIRPPVSSTRLLGIGAASAEEGDDAWGTARLSAGGGGDDGAAPTPSPAEIEVDAETSSSITSESSSSDKEEEEAARRSQTWGRRDVLGGMLVDSNDDDDGPDADDPNAARSLVRGNAQLSSSSVAEVDRMRRARDCGDSIAAGAVASAGGLSTNLREWAAVEDEDASFVKVSDVPWMVAMEAGERNAREEKRNSKLNASSASSSSSPASSSSATLEVRDKEETELTAKYDTMLAWVLDKGGVVKGGVNVSKVIGKPGDGRGLVTTGLTESSSSGGDESSSIVNVGDAVVKIPIALALSHVAARTYRVNDQPVGTLLRPLFNEQPTYALGKFISICPFLFPSVWEIRLTLCLCFFNSHDAPTRTVQARSRARVAVGAVREDAAARGAVRVGSPNPARYLRRGTSARVGTNG